jgi:hypothetical protein
MFLAQTELSKWVIFLAVPLYVHLELNKSKNDSNLKRILKLLNLILFIGLFSGFLHILNYDLYFFGRDIMYFAQAPIFILLGIYLCRNSSDYHLLLRLTVITSFIITIYKLIELIVNPTLIFQLGLYTRYEYDLSNPTALVAFIILFYARLIKIKLFNRKLENLFLWISLFSVIISFSRTFYVLLLVLILVYFIKKKESVFKLYWGIVIFSLFIIFGGLIFDIESSSLDESTFKSKVNHSLTEIVVRDYKTQIDILQNWRGYEAFMGLQKFYSGNVFEVLFGQGFGAVVYTPQWIFANEENNLSVIPMFHNGFITILLKTGLFGLILFFLFFYKILKFTSLKQPPSVNQTEKFTALLLKAIVFITLIQTLVVHGIFTTSVPFLLIILTGASIKMLLLEKRRLKKTKSIEVIS